MKGIPVSSLVNVRAKKALCADDTMIFTATQQAINTAEETLQAYMNASGASLNWNESIAIPMGSWKDKPHRFRCPTLEADKRVHYLGIYLGQTRLDNPWQAMIQKVTKGLEIWRSTGLSMVTRASICLTLIASCVRCHSLPRSNKWIPKGYPKLPMVWWPQEGRVLSQSLQLYQEVGWTWHPPISKQSQTLTIWGCRVGGLSQMQGLY